MILGADAQSSSKQQPTSLAELITHGGKGVRGGGKLTDKVEAGKGGVTFFR